MKITKPEIEMPKPIKVKVAQENLHDDSSLEPGDYWLLFDGPVHIDLLTDVQLRAKYKVVDVP